MSALALPQRLQTARREAGLSPSQIARLLDVPAEEWTLWEAGTVVPDEAQLRRIADTCDVSELWLTTGQIAAPLDLSVQQALDRSQMPADEKQRLVALLQRMP